MIISVASGKGGTGKTTIAVNLALALKNKYEVQLLDCDVEEPNAHLFLKPLFSRVKDVQIPIPRIDESKCNFCGKCAEICVFNALMVIKDNVLVFEQMCHGCGGCTLFCPEKAITETGRKMGIVEAGTAYEKVKFVHGKLNIGEAISPLVIDMVKENLTDNMINIIDAPPGTSCPVVAAVKGSDYCVLVTEPTPFGLNDLELAASMLKKMQITTGIIINKCDTGDDSVKDFCEKEKLPILMEIPWSREIATLYAKGELVANHIPSWKEKMVELFNSIKNEVSTS